MRIPAQSIQPEVPIQENSLVLLDATEARRKEGVSAISNTLSISPDDLIVEYIVRLVSANGVVMVRHDAHLLVDVMESRTITEPLTQFRERILTSHGNAYKAVKKFFAKHTNASEGEIRRADVLINKFTEDDKQQKNKRPPGYWEAS